jgi:hypothetical protein
LPETLLAHEPAIRLSAFAGILSLMALWELFAPRRHQAIGRASRWPGNLGIVVLDSLLVRIVFPTAAVGVALIAEARGWGLLHALDVPTWMSVLAGVILLDLPSICSTSCFTPCRCCGDCIACTTRISSSM